MVDFPERSWANEEPPWIPFPRQTIPSFSKPLPVIEQPEPLTHATSGYEKIGICGQLHAGKSTLAKYLIERGYEHRAFAGPVKEFAVTTLNNIWYDKAQEIGSEYGWDPITLEDIDDDKARYRPLLQFIGEYGRREFGEDVWIDIFRQKDLPKKVVVDDVRHHNEVEWLKENGFYVVRVNRPEDDRVASIKKSFESSHNRPMKKKDLKSMMSHESEIHVPDLEADEDIFNIFMADLESSAHRLAG